VFHKVKLSVKVKLLVSLLCICNFACKGHPWNDLYCVGRDIKPYSLTHSRLVASMFRVTAPPQKYGKIFYKLL